jgi:MYXO-CTERM domain-containing protein
MNSNAKTLVKTLLLALLAAPLAASAQVDADLAVTVAPLTGTANEGQLTPGETKTYAVVVTNAGPSTAQGVQLLFPSLDPKLKITNVAGCALKTTDPSTAAAWPCTIGDISDVVGSAEVTLDVQWVTTTTWTTCPTSEVFAPSVFVVESTGTIDPTFADTQTSDTPVAGAIADLKFSLTASTADAGPGTQFTVTALVRNAGPCAAPEVTVLDYSGVSDLKMTFVSSTGCAEGTTTNPADWLNFQTCTLGTLDPETTGTFVGTYIVGSMASDELQRGTPISLNAFSGIFAYADGPNDGAARDPVEGDNGGAITVKSSQSVSSCSSGGVPGALGLLALALPLWRRRRR